MRFSEKSLGFVINFLLGVAWATALIGAVSTFLAYYSESLLFAFIFGVLATLPGMIALLILEFIITHKEQYQQLIEQTKLLEKLLIEKTSIH